MRSCGGGWLKPAFNLGEHDVFTRIGKRGMGAVWRAVHRPSGTNAAIKIMTVDSLDDPHLDDPHIVQLFDYGIVDQHLPIDEMGELVGSLPCDGIGRRGEFGTMAVRASL